MRASGCPEEDWTSAGSSDEEGRVESKGKKVRGVVCVAISTMSTVCVAISNVGVHT